MGMLKRAASVLLHNVPPVYTPSPPHRRPSKLTMTKSAFSIIWSTFVNNFCWIIPPPAFSAQKSSSIYPPPKAIEGRNTCETRSHSPHNTVLSTSRRLQREVTKIFHSLKALRSRVNIIIHPLKQNNMLFLHQTLLSQHFQLTGKHLKFL